MHFICVCRHRIIFGLHKSHRPKEILLFTLISTNKVELLLNLNTRHFLYLCWRSMFNHPCPFHTSISVATKCMNYYTLWLRGSALLFYLVCSRFQFSFSWVFCSKLFLSSSKSMMDYNLLIYLNLSHLLSSPVSTIVLLFYMKWCVI